MIRMLLSVIVFFLLFSSQAQQPLLKWAKPFHANNASNYRDYSNGRTIGVDKQGNVYTAGFFSHTIDFDPGPAVFNLTGEDSGPEQQGIFLSKLDSNGNFVWAKQIPVYAGFSNIELKVDPNGTIYLTSVFDDTVDFDPGSGVFALTSIGFQDAFVIKLSADGELIWVKQFGGKGDTGSTSNALDVDEKGNVYVTGQFNNTVDFDPGAGVYNLTATAHTKSYIVKLSANGDLVWAKQYGEAPTTYGGAVIYDLRCDKRGAIYAAGIFGGACDFDPGNGVYTLTSTGLQDGFIARIDTDGNFGWAKQLMHSGTEYNSFLSIQGVEIDGNQNVVAVGSFIGTFDLDPGAGVFNRTSVGGTDCFMVKLNAQGNFNWAKVWIGNEGESGNDLVIDAANNIYATGSFGRVIDLDPGPGEYIVNSPFYGAPAIIKLSPEGNFVYGINFPGLEHNSCMLRRMDIDDARNIYVTGSVGGVVDFDPGPGIFPVRGTQDMSPYVLKLGPCTNSTASTLNVVACDRYSLNGEVFDSTGTYLRTISNATGCDSVITLHLTVNNRRSSRTVTICAGETFFAEGKMQTQSGIYSDTLQTWQGCDSVVTTTLVVNEVPQPQLGADRDLCSNEQLTLSPGVFSSYTWHNNAATDSITVTAAGLYWVEVTNQLNCKARDTIVIKNILPAPVHFLKERDSICSYERLDIAPLQPYENYKWSTGETVRSVQVLQPGLYWLQVTDTYGCTGTDSIAVYAKQCMLGVYFPNAFTPNGDGLNDVFKPMLFGVVKQYRFAVYNRWGKEVFQTKEPYKGWDGRVAGVLQPNTAFVWTCTYQLEGGELKTERGTVLLIK